MEADSPDRADLVPLAAAAEILLAIAERVEGEIADEAILVELHEFRDRVHAAIRQLSEH